MSEVVREGAELGAVSPRKMRLPVSPWLGVVEEGNWKTSPAEQAPGVVPARSIAAPPGSDGILPARLLPDCLNLCSLVLQPLCFTRLASVS